MKLLKLTLIVLIAFISFQSASALPLFDFGIHVGLATPNDQMSRVYNSDKLSSGDSKSSILYDAASAGYHISFSLKMELSENVFFNGGIGMNRFPRTNFDISKLDTAALSKLNVSTSIIPISAGLQYYFVNSNLIGLYVAGNLSYNFISSHVDILENVGLPADLVKRPSDHRIGYGLGGGLDINIPVAGTVNLEALYHNANLIGKDDDEKNKNYFTLTLGFYFL